MQKPFTEFERVNSVWHTFHDDDGGDIFASFRLKASLVGYGNFIHIGSPPLPLIRAEAGTRIIPREYFESGARAPAEFRYNCEIAFRNGRLGCSQ
jgi:hypothetical protein